DGQVQQGALCVGVARDREQDGRHVELVEQLEQARDGRPVDQVAGRQVLEAVALEVAVDRIEVAGQHGVAHALARRRASLRTAVRTASAMKSTWRSVWNAVHRTPTSPSRPRTVVR